MFLFNVNTLSFASHARHPFKSGGMHLCFKREKKIEAVQKSQLKLLLKRATFISRLNCGALSIANPQTKNPIQEHK